MSRRATLLLRALGLRLAVLAAALALALGTTSAAQQPGGFMLLGCKVAAFDHPPLVSAGGRDYITSAALRQLRQAAGQAKAAATGVKATSPVGGDPAGSFPLGTHSITLGAAGADSSVKIDGVALGGQDLFQYAGEQYISAAQYAKAGLKLCYNARQQLYQLVGEIQKVDYRATPPSLAISCATPIAVSGEQVDAERLTFTAEGGWIADTQTHEFADDPVLSRLSFKSQPELGRSFIFVRQPQRTGFKVDSDPAVGFARVKFGNYFQVASWQKSSSGEISLNVQLGAPCAVTHDLLADPPRLVVDFTGAIFEDATREIAVNSGRVKQIRIGQPEPGHVRVVLDLTERADYRVLTGDDGARLYVQLLPPVEGQVVPAQLRRGRVIMLDAGHGGSDPGAPGVLSGVWEAPLNLKIAQLVEQELSAKGYEVLQTRSADRFTSLGSRSDYANGVLPYIFVSIHCNSIETPDYSGIMTFHFAGSLEGARLAQCVHEAALAATGAVDKSVRTANFFVLRETVMPSTLIECGFLTNEAECRNLADSAYQKKLAAGIAAGIDRYVTSGL